MTMVSDLINKESLRNQKMIAEYEKELETLPKGSLKIKSVGNNVYYYLVYRNGKKVISKYVGNNPESLTKIKEGLERRNHVEAILKQLKTERAQIKKMETLL